VNTWPDLVSQGIARSQAQLQALTTYKLGGPAALLVEPESIDHLDAIAAANRNEPRPMIVVGRGSNLVIADNGFDGVVIRLGKEFAAINVDEVVTAGAAAGLPQVARAATKSGRLGIEFMVGIPGTVGGGVRQNAGCFGQDIASVLVETSVYDIDQGAVVLLTNDDLEFGYRHSSIRSTQVVTEALFTTSAGAPEFGEDRMKEITKWRRLHQPGGTLNAGSVFKNPPNDTAGRIIDSMGLKGFCVGGASVSEKHANFFVAMPGTKAREVYLLVQEVARRVKEETGIMLEPEIQFVGDFDKVSNETD
jgi:UDP-N-acetylmuramate dehydrogenase